jgi:prophage DNA circulation protein
MQKHLEKQVAETAAVVAGWKNTIAKIETQFNIANLALLNAKKNRETHALKAAMSDAAALAAVKHARSEQHTAEQTIGDLKIALPEAEAHLAAAEKAAESARHELAKLHGEKIMRARVAAAARMDAGFFECAAAYSDFERLGRELQSFPDLNIAVSGNMSHWETVTGFRRIAAALPTFFMKLFPTTWTNEDARQSLAASEEKFWQLPPEQPEAKAA